MAKHGFYELCEEMSAVHAVAIALTILSEECIAFFFLYLVGGSTLNVYFSNFFHLTNRDQYIGGAESTPPVHREPKIGRTG